MGEKIDLSTPTDASRGDMTYVARRNNLAVRGLVVGFPDDMSFALIAWGPASRLTTHYAAAQAVHEDPENLIRWEDRHVPADRPAVSTTTRISTNGSTSIIVTPPRPCGLQGCVAELHVTIGHNTTRVHLNAQQRRELMTGLFA